MNQLDQENGDYDLTSSVTVLTDTPDASNPKVCQAYLAIGDGTKDLDGTGGDFEVVITVGSQTLEPSPQTITFSTATRVCLFTHAFPVPANTQVTVALKSPNAGDSDVDVTATLYDVTGGTDQSGDAYAYLGTNLGAAGANATEAGGDGDHLTEAGGDGDHLTESGGTGDQFTAITSLALSTENSDNLIAVVNAWLNGGRLDLLIDAIKAVTDAIPDNGALTALLASIASILEDTGTTIPASMATLANQTTIESKIDTVDGIVDDILEDTGTTLPAAIAAGAVAGGSGSTLRTEIERLAGIDQATIYGSDELFAVGTGDTSYVTWGKAVYDSDNSKTVVFYTTTDGGLNVIRRIDSTDGKTSWNNRADCVAADDTWNAGGVWVGNVAIVDSTWYMFCAGRTADAATLSVGLYTSADGATWTASESNPILSPTLDWQVSSIEPTGLIRVGDTLHMFYTTLPTTSSSVPIYARKIGRASAAISDLTTWTDHGVVFGDGDDEYDEQPFHGYYSAEPFKNGTNGYYYLIVAKYGPAADYSQFELWECYDISFDKDKRRYVKTIAVTQDVGTFPDREWDIASILTDDAYKMVDSITATSDEIRIYAGCKDTDTWKQALLLYDDVHELLRPGIPVNHAYDGQLPQTRWAKSMDSIDVGGKSLPVAVQIVSAAIAGATEGVEDDSYSEEYHDFSGTKVMTVTYDSDLERTSITYHV
jgi:hypothetical protein